MSEEVNFDSLNLKISEIICNYPDDLKREIYEYLSGLDDIHRKGYQIAYDHLGTSFNIARSNGFKKWLAEKSSK
jgi:hypothetical protein